MKIAVVVGGFPAISETFILNQITGLIDLGYDVEIFAEGKGEEGKIHPDVQKYGLLSKTHYIDKEIPKNKVKRICKAMPLALKIFFKNPIIAIKIFNFIKFGKDVLTLRIIFFVSHFLDKDILHFHFGSTAIGYLWLKDILKIKFVVSFHGYDATKYVQKYGKNVYEALFKKADLFTVNSKYIIQKVINIGCPEHKILHLPVGLNPEIYKFPNKNLHNGEQIKILTIARLVEKKGVEYSIRAVAELLHKYPSLTYRIAGDGLLRNELGKLILDLGVKNKIHLLGWKNNKEIAELLDDSHIFILSSVTAMDGDEEGQGLVLQEAQVVGLPVIATRHNGFPESLIDGKSGFLVPERDVDALAEKLEYLINHPETWPDMGKAGRKFVEEKFDIRKLNKRLVEIYEGLLKNKRE